MIFVFGSNLIGVHGAGAARAALRHHGAIWGHGAGLQGNSYAIPTKDHLIETLPLETIKEFVDSFVEFARQRQDLGFQVTCIGCGLAGLKHEHIAPMFKDAPAYNVFFDTLWKPYLEGRFDYWGTF